MSDAENYERGYHGHDRGVVVANDGHGNFIVRQMTPAELAARAPIWAIGGEPYDFMSQAIDAALAAQAEADHRRVIELLEANTREVERRREAEKIVELARDLMRYAKIENCASDRVFVSKERAYALNAALDVLVAVDRQGGSPHD